MSAAIEPAFEAGKPALTMVPTGIWGAKIKKSIDREEILAENLNRAFTILHVQCNESLFDKLGGDRKYEAIECEQDLIEMLKLI